MVGRRQHDDPAQARRQFLAKGIAYDDVAEGVGDKVVAVGLYLLLDELDQFAGYLIEGSTGLIVRKIQSLVTRILESPAQNEQGGSGAPLSMQKDNGFLLLRRRSIRLGRPRSGTTRHEKE
jgi:hypothetical protein